MADRTGRLPPLSADEAVDVIYRVHGRRLTRGMLQHYTREGYLKPRPVGESRGRRGRPATVFYDATDLVLLGWLVRLASQGVKFRKFARGIASLRARLPEALEDPERLRFFVVNGDEVAVTVDGNLTIQLTGAEGQVLLVFSAERDVREVVERGWSLIEDRVRQLGA